jgi:hypothetical protein
MRIVQDVQLCVRSQSLSAYVWCCAHNPITSIDRLRGSEIQLRQAAASYLRIPAAVVEVRRGSSLRGKGIHGERQSSTSFGTCRKPMVGWNVMEWINSPDAYCGIQLARSTSLGVHWLVIIN